MMFIDDKGKISSKLNKIKINPNKIIHADQ